MTDKGGHKETIRLALHTCNRCPQTLQCWSKQSHHPRKDRKLNLSACVWFLIRGFFLVAPGLPKGWLEYRFPIENLENAGKNTDLGSGGIWEAILL